MVATPSAVMGLHGLNAGQWDTITNVLACNGFGPESDTFCVYCSAAIVAYDEAMEVGPLNWKKKDEKTARRGKNKAYSISLW
jgi:hypothetical protein